MRQHQPQSILPHCLPDKDSGDDPFTDADDELCICEENRLLTPEEVTLGMCASCINAEEYRLYTAIRRHRMEVIQRLSNEINARAEILPPALLREFNKNVLLYLTNAYDLDDTVPSRIREVALIIQDNALDTLACIMNRAGNYFSANDADDWMTACGSFVEEFRSQLGEDILERW